MAANDGCPSRGKNLSGTAEAKEFILEYLDSDDLEVIDPIRVKDNTDADLDDIHEAFEQLESANAIVKTDVGDHLSYRKSRHGDDKRTWHGWDPRDIQTPEQLESLVLDESLDRQDELIRAWVSKLIYEAHNDLAGQEPNIARLIEDLRIAAGVLERIEVDQ